MKTIGIAVGFVVLVLVGRLAEAMLDAGHGLPLIATVGLVVGVAAYRLLTGGVRV